VKFLGTRKGDDDKPIADIFGADFDKVVEALTPQVIEDRVVTEVSSEALSKSFAKLAARASEAALRHEHAEQLKQIAIAMHNYHDVYGRFPARAGYGKVDIEALRKEGKESPDLTVKPDANSKPLLSWRVYLLPYIEQQQLFQEFHLD